MRLLPYLKIILISLLLLPGIGKAQAQEETPRIALSSNLLSWATLAPNLGIEAYIGKSFSVAADGSYGLWDYSRTYQSHSLQTWSVGAEARYWLQARQHGFRRTYVGISVRGGEYDFNDSKKGYKGEALLAGITAGYCFALRGNWFLDAGLGIGYIHTRYDRYFLNRRFRRYEFNGERTRNVFGLTNLHASLVYRFPSKKN